MPKKPRNTSGNSGRPQGGSPESLPKWRREGFSSYRQYLNDRYRKLGYSSFADYSAKRKKDKAPRGEVKRKPKKPPRGEVKRKPKKPPRKQKPRPIQSRELQPVAKMSRTEYSVIVPFRYGIGDLVGSQLVGLAEQLQSHIEAIHPPDKIHSGAYRIFGRIARALDANGNPIFEPGEEEYYDAHQNWDKAMSRLKGLLHAFGNHEFKDYGLTIGARKGGPTSSIYVLIVTRFAVSVIWKETK